MSAELERYAVARLDWNYNGRFLLNHDAHTADKDSEFYHEATGGTITSGVHAEVESHQLRLMGYPFNTHVVYAILCEDCHADDASALWGRSEDEQFWIRGSKYLHLCASCWSKRDNAEPPEPDGEAFRGGEAAAFQAEQMAAAQRLK